MKKYTERIVNLAFCLMLLAILAGPISRYSARAQLVEENARMDRARKLETALESALRTVDDAETGQRGFLLTHDPACLAPFADAVDQMQVQMRKINQLTAGAPDEQTQVALLDSLMKQEFGELNQAVATVLSTPDATFDLARFNEGKATMDRIRQVVGGLRTQIQKDLDRREAVLAIDLAQTARVFLLVTVFNFVCLIVSFILVRRVLVHEKRLEVDLRQTRAALLDAIECVDAGFMMYGPDTRLVLCNTRYKEMFPVLAHAMVPGTLYEDIVRFVGDSPALFAPGTSTAEWAARRLAAHRNPGEPTIERLGDRWLRFSDHRTSQGGIVSLRMDVTPLKQAQDAAQAANRICEEQLEEMEQLYRSAPVGLELLDGNCRVLRINERLAAINGKSVQEHIGRDLREIVPELAAQIEAVWSNRSSPRESRS